jgi:probable HAF family extracellular repeat protein
MQDLGNVTAVAHGINNSSNIVGQQWNTPITDAFLDNNGSVQNLGDNATTAWGINDNGVVVGYLTFPYQIHGNQDAFIYTGGAIQDLHPQSEYPGANSQATAINDKGQAVGFIDPLGNANFEAVLFGSPVTYLGNLGGNYSIAYAINNSGQIVGVSATTNGGNDVFLYAGGSMLDIGPGYEYGTYGINNSGFVVGQDGNNHAFVYANGTRADLNTLLFNTNSGWTLQDASAINDVGQIAGYGINPQGQTHAFLLNPLPPGSIPAAATAQTNLPVYIAPPTPQENKNSLIVITHGEITDSKTLAEAIEFVNSTSNAIFQYLSVNDIYNWQVQGCLWTSQAETVVPPFALYEAGQQGHKLAKSLIAQGNWTHIHFIAHSAGAGLIQAATDDIKTSLPNTVIHCTFLDAYDGVLGEQAYLYGSNANWADSYFIRDLFQQDRWTGCLLPHAYNVDVTALDPNADSKLPWYYGSFAPIFQALSDHGWPPSFYSNSILGAINTNTFMSIPYGTNYNGFGFPLSEEGGHWNYALDNYPPGNGVSWGYVTTLGPSGEIYTMPSITPYTGSVPSFAVASTIQSTTGTVSTSPGYASAQTGSPVWVSTVITDTNALNFVSFDAEFTSVSGADGLLTVYWDTNMIGEVDEAAVQPGLQYYVFSFPNTAPNTSHVLGFHVDPFTSIHSSLVLTNIVTGSAGVAQPFSLSITTNKSDGLLVYQLAGQLGVYSVQSSLDLLNWTTVAYLGNTNGTVNFVDPNSTNYPCQFYRATSPTGLSQ